MPVFKPDKGAITQVENLVDEALEEHNESIRDEIIAAIDELVFEIHDIDASHRKEIHAFFQE